MVAGIPPEYRFGETIQLPLIILNILVKCGIISSVAGYDRTDTWQMNKSKRQPQFEINKRRVSGLWR